MDQWIEMHICTFAALLLALVMALLALAFGLGKARAARWISGFSTMTPERQRGYDRERMARDMRDLYLKPALILLAGAAASMASRYLVIPAFILWALWFFRSVHVDQDKAFGKYKIKR